MSKTFNVAVVGYGLSAKVFHIPFIQAVPELKLYGIVQRTPKPDDDCAKDHPGVKSWRSIDDALADPQVDLVVITSVPETHFDMSKRSMEAGKRVVCEKPFVPTSREAEELVQVSRQTGQLLIVYQNRRYDSDYNTLVKAIKDGLLGDIAEFETHFDRHRPEPPAESWKVADVPGHGAIYDLGTHLIDQVYHLFGMPKRVTGFVGHQRRGISGGAADSCTVLLHYDGPMLVTVKAGVVSPEEEQLRFWVRGTKGSFKKYHLDPQEDQLREEGRRPGDEGFGVEPESHHGSITTVVDGKLKRETYPTIEPPLWTSYYADVAKALKGERDSPVLATDARDVLKIIELAIQSSKDGRTIEV